MTGIYQILNIVTNKRYVGSSFDIESRFVGHKSALSRGLHNKKLQNSWNKYGKRCFEFSILELVESITTKELEDKEQYWIDFYDSYYKGYNARPKASSNKGMKISDTSKMSKASTIRNLKRSRKCILYNLDGSFYKVCNSFQEAEKITGLQPSCSIKSRSGRCKNYLVTEYSENFPLKIDKYSRTVVFDNPVERGKRISTALKERKFSEESKAKMKKAKDRGSVLKINKKGELVEEYRTTRIAIEKNTRDKVYSSLKHGNFTREGFKFIRKSLFLDK